jgi:hypothetical protein
MHIGVLRQSSAAVSWAVGEAKHPGSEGSRHFALMLLALAAALIVAAAAFPDVFACGFSQFGPDAP